MKLSIKTFTQTLPTALFLFLMSCSMAKAYDEDGVTAVPIKGQAIKPIENRAVTGRLGSYEGATDGTTFAFYLVFIWRALIFVAGFAVLISLVTGALDWINAGGDKAKIEKAREKMTQAVVGFVVLIGLIAISTFLELIFGIKILNPTLPTVSTF